jgi:hypothetical protein
MRRFAIGRFLLVGPSYAAPICDDAWTMPADAPRGEGPGAALRYLVLAVIAAFVLMAVALLVVVTTGR